MKVSVIIPCFNAENHIEECLSSVMLQNHSDVEIICVNDGSTDNTKSIIQKKIDNSRFPIQLINQENHGAQYSRNVGLKAAAGEYFQFLDADDLVLEDKISTQIRLAESHQNPSIIAGSHVREDIEGVELSHKILSQPETINVWELLMQTKLGITSANLFHAEPFKNGVLWDVNLKHSQEYQLMFNILKFNSSVAFDHQPNTIRRVGNSKTISLTKEMDKWLAYVQLRIDIVQFLQKHKPEIMNVNFRQMLFDAIRMYYPHNPKHAVDIYQQSFPKFFLPMPSQVTSKGYIQLFRILGFKKTEKFKGLLGKFVRR